MRTTTDLVVLGAGPAGSVLAWLAARAGLTVVVLERDRFPRDKVCGEFMSSEGAATLARVGALDPLLDRGAVWIDRFRLSDPRGRQLDAKLPALAGLDGRGLGVSRALLDAALAERAVAAGARLVERATALAPVVDSAGRVRGVRYREAGRSGACELSAAVVAACDGRRSSLVRALHPRLGDPRTTGPGSIYGLKAHLEGTVPRLDGAVELHPFRGGYLGLSHVEGRRVNLALVVTKRALREHGGDPERLLRERLVNNPAVAEAVASRPTAGPWKSVGPLRFGIRKPSASGALFLGDAAGTIDPVSGEGMSHALLSAELATPFAIRAAAGGELSAADAAAYDRAWRRAFAASMRRNRVLGRLLEGPWTSLAGLTVIGSLPGPAVPWLVRASRTGAHS